MTSSFRLLLLLLTLLLSPTVAATPASGTCTRPNRTKLNAWAYSAAPIPFGDVNLANVRLQPPGSHLASVLAPSTNYTYNGADPNTVLWRCDKRAVDAGKVYFMVSVNGDSRYGGYHEIGQEDGLDDVYATWFDYIGLRLSMSGVTVSRNWKKVPLDTYSVISYKDKEYVEIQVRDIPPLQAELYRVSRPVPAGGGVWECAYWANRTPSEAGASYECEEPSAYLQLVGPGLPHDKEGEDSSTRHLFWYTNGIGYSLYRALTMTSSATCMVRSGDTQVRFPTVSAQALQAGAEVPADFSIEVECNNRVISGTGSGEVAIGLQVSPEVSSTAWRMGLVDPQGGVHFLLSDGYDTHPDIARGVGILLLRAGQPQRFLGVSSIGGGEPGKGALAGWYPVLQDDPVIATTAPDHLLYRLDFSARLRALPLQTVTPGKVRAHVNIVVRVQ